MTIEQYDGKRLYVDRYSSTGRWVSLGNATAATYNNHDDPNEKGTFIKGAETGTVTVTQWGLDLAPPFSPADKVRLRYVDQDGVSHIIINGVVDSTKTLWYSADGYLPKRFRYDFSATLVGKTGLALSTTVCWPDLPKESAYKRLTRFVKIRNLSMTAAESETEVTP